MKRGKLEQTIDILRIVRTPTLKTHILNKANTDFNTFASILKILTQKGLIATIAFKKSTRPHYVLTDKGKETLTIANSLIAQFDEDAPHSQPLLFGRNAPSPFSSRKSA